MLNLKDIRQDYKKYELEKSQLDQDPIEQLKKWYQEADKDNNHEPNAMTLSTTNNALEVSSRIVLLKEITVNTLRFFTNYSSDKGKDIETNNKVALLFFWPASERQVRIKGIANKSEEKVSDAYFYSRPMGSQAGAVASEQSTVLDSKDTLIEAYETIKNATVFERPKHWGGYDVTPYEMEFWQGGMNRLHDRFRFTLENNDWKIERLAP